jgi:hypothetical protein
MLTLKPSTKGEGRGDLWENSKPWIIVAIFKKFSPKILAILTQIAAI